MGNYAGMLTGHAWSEQEGLRCQAEICNAFSLGIKIGLSAILNLPLEIVVPVGSVCPMEASQC